MQRFGSRLIVLSAVLAGLWVSPVLACVMQLVPASVTVIRNSGTNATIVAGGYDTFGSTPAQFCACGLAAADTACIKSINSVSIVNAGTTTPIAGFAFSTNATTTAEFHAALSNPTWQGFWSSVSTSIPAGTVIDLRFDVTLESSCTDMDVRVALTSGAARIGSDEATAGGNLTGGHLNIQAPYSAVPSLSWFGAGLLAILLCGLGVIVVRRRRTARTAIA